jgi:hypothetical protein
MPKLDRLYRERKQQGFIVFGLSDEGADSNERKKERKNHHSLREPETKLSHSPSALVLPAYSPSPEVFARAIAPGVGGTLR